MVSIAERSRPMVAAACSPVLVTSPTTSATRAPDSAMTSNQSPPAPPVPVMVPGTYARPASIALFSGRRAGSRLRCRAEAVVVVRVWRRALSTLTAASSAISVASPRSASSKGVGRSER